MVINKNHLQDKSRGLGSSPEVSMLLLLVFFFFSVYIWSNIYLKSMHATAFKVGKWLVCHFGVVVVVRLISFPCPLFLLSSLIVVKHCKHPFPINWPYGRLHGNQIFTFFLPWEWCHDDASGNFNLVFQLVWWEVDKQGDSLGLEDLHLPLMEGINHFFEKQNEQFEVVKILIAVSAKETN